MFDRVGICNLDEDYVGEFGNGGGAGEGQFNLLWGIAADDEGQV